MAASIHSLRLGDTFSNPGSKSYHSLRYNFKPESIAQTGTGKLSAQHSEGNENAVQVELPSSNADGDPIYFTGNQEASKGVECILLWDESSKGYVIERLDSIMRVHAARSKPKDTMGERTTSSNQETVGSPSNSKAPNVSLAPTPVGSPNPTRIHKREASQDTDDTSTAAASKRGKIQPKATSSNNDRSGAPEVIQNSSQNYRSSSVGPSVSPNSSLNSLQPLPMQKSMSANNNIPQRNLHSVKSQQVSSPSPLNQAAYPSSSSSSSTDSSSASDSDNSDEDSDMDTFAATLNANLSQSAASQV